MLLALVLAAPAVFTERRFNTGLLDLSVSAEVHSLRGGLARTGVRYIGIVETLPPAARAHALDGAYFYGRVAGKQEWNGRLVAHENYRLVAFAPGDASGMLTLVGTDEATSSNADVAYGDGRYWLVGGGNDAGGRAVAGVRYVQVRGARRSTYDLVLAPVDVPPPARAWADVLRGAWLSRAADWTAAMSEHDHAGCTDATHAPGCCQDGRFSLVFSRGRWLLFGRANLSAQGGRSVQVARSAAADPRGPWGPFSLLRWEGFEVSGWRNQTLYAQNVYFAAVRAHPEDEGLLIGLFPVNEGEPQSPSAPAPNGNTGGYMGLALSCDGVAWTRPQPLLWSPGLNGRLEDHPVVGGLWLDEARRLVFYVQHHVPGISTHAREEGHVRRHALRPGAIDRLAREARSSLAGCAGPPLAPPVQAPDAAAAKPRRAAPNAAAAAKAAKPPQAAAAHNASAAAAAPHRATHTAAAAAASPLGDLRCLGCRARKCSSLLSPPDASSSAADAAFPSCACERCAAECARAFGCDSHAGARCVDGYLRLDARVRVTCDGASASFRDWWAAQQRWRARQIIVYPDDGQAAAEAHLAARLDDAHRDLVTLARAAALALGAAGLALVACAAWCSHRLCRRREGGAPAAAERRSARAQRDSSLDAADTAALIPAESEPCLGANRTAAQARFRI